MFAVIAQSIATRVTLLLFYAMGFALFHRYDKKRQSNGSGRAWDFTFFIFAMVAVLILEPVLLPILSFRTAATWGLIIQIIGICAIGIAVSLHIWSRAHLQQFYAERIEIQPEYKIIDTGPDKLMRHPVITSFFGIATGLFLINHALTTLAALLYTIWDFSRAARQEGGLLSPTLPRDAESARRTPRFLPRLSRNR